MTRTFNHGSLHITAGWHRGVKHFTLDISAPGDIWLEHLEDLYRSADESSAMQASFNVPALEAQLRERGIVAPDGFLSNLQSDAQENRADEVVPNAV